jgi:serine/threonine protein kinase
VGVTSLAALQPGDPQRIGPYVLLGRLGSGGMGRVYLARSPGGRMVAVKVIRSNLAEDAGFRARFAREVSAARKVGGLFTAAVVDADVDGPVPWLVTAYVPGTSLSDAVEQQGPLPESSVLALAAGLAEGLSAIHAAGVIHRDLKPSNVLLAQDGPRIIDFGISSAAGATSLTGTGFMIGSPGFMSPEQAEGLVVGPASDIFSLAGVLIYAARGEGPFGSGDTAALLYRVVHGKPNMDNTPDHLRPLIKRSLSRDAKRRPTATQFLAELSAAYPAAADLSNWLPARILDPSAAGTTSAEAGPHQPGSMAGSSVPSGPQPGGPYGSGSYGGGSMAGAPAGGASMADRYEPDPVAPAADAIPPAAAAASAFEAQAGGTLADPPTRTTLSSSTPPPPTTPPTGPQGYQGYQGQGYPGAQGYQAPQAYQGQHGYQGQQQYPEPQGYQTGQGGPAQPQAGGWWGAQQPGGPSGPGVPGEWYTPGTGPGRPSKRPKWLVPAGVAVVAVVVLVSIILAVTSGSGQHNGPTSGSNTTPAQTHSASASPSGTPRTGNLQLAQFQVGDCLTGANLQLNKNTPWPKLSQAVPCSEGHTAEVFYANNAFWAKSGPYPGDSGIKATATAECNKAFQSYVGIAYSKSVYTWTDVVPDANTWPGGDRALHCVAYYATNAQPAGEIMHASIKGTAK